MFKKAGWKVWTWSERRKRGSNREILTLGGAKRQETNLKRKTKRKVNKLRGKAGFPAQR